MKKTLTLATALVLTLGGVAAPAEAGCASYPGAKVVRCVQDTPQVQKKLTKAQKKLLKRLSLLSVKYN